MFNERGFGYNPENINKKRTFYEVLGVSTDATQDEIKAAWMKRVKETHPDRPENRDKEEEHKSINEAYQAINDPDKRTAYDAKLYAHQGTSNSRSKSEARTEQDASERKNASERTSDRTRRTSDANSEYRTAKEKLDALKKELFKELEDLYKDPVRNKAKIDNFQQYVKQRMDEAVGRSTSGFRSDTSSSRESTARENTTYERPRAQTYHTPHQDRPEPASRRGGFTIKRTGSFVSLVDERGFSIGSTYKDIQQNGRYYIGTGIIGYQSLIDGNTGKELSSSYKKIDIVGEFIIASDVIGYQRLLDTNTGRDLSKSYKQISIMDNMPIAHEISGYQRLLDRNTGKELFSSYKGLVLRDGLLIGQDIAGYERLIDKRTGRELSSSMYKRIERRDGKIIGHRIYGEEEIKVNYQN